MLADIQRDLEESATLLLFRHCFWLGHFYTVFDVIEVFVAVKQVDVRNANSQVFQVDVTLPARLEFSGLCGAEEESSFDATHWLHREGVNNLEVVDTSERACIKAKRLQRDVQLARLDEGINHNIFLQNDMISRS